MEQKAKKYEDLNKYERAMTNASLEQRLEAMAKDLQQITKALKISVDIDSTFHDWQAHDSEEPCHASVAVIFIKGDEVIRRDVVEDGDLFGIIEEAKAK